MKTNHTKDTMTPDKVEEIVKEFEIKFVEKGNLDWWQTDLEYPHTARPSLVKDWLTTTLTQHHQDMMSEVIKDINQMWVDELSRKDREEGATAIGYSKIVSYLKDKITKI